MSSGLSGESGSGTFIAAEAPGRANEAAICKSQEVSEKKGLMGKQRRASGNPGAAFCVGLWQRSVGSLKEQLSHHTGSGEQRNSERHQ